MRTFVFIMFIYFTSINCFCVENKDTLKVKKNSIFIEFGGKGLFYSINYDRTIPISGYFGTDIGAGFTYILTTGFISINEQIFSPEIDFYYGKTHKAEIGYSKALFLNCISGAELQSFRIGYRYQKKQGGLLFRASYCPFYSANSGGTWFQWVGISVGSVF